MKTSSCAIFSALETLIECVMKNYLYNLTTRNYVCFLNETASCYVNYTIPEYWSLICNIYHILVHQVGVIPITVYYLFNRTSRYSATDHEQRKTKLGFVISCFPFSENVRDICDISSSNKRFRDLQIKGSAGRNLSFIGIKCINTW